MGPYPIVRTLSSTNPKTVPRPPRPKSAAGDGAEAILSIEREDAEDRVRKKVGLFSKLVIPLVLGLLVSALGVAVFWFLRGRPKLW